MGRSPRIPRPQTRLVNRDPVGDFPSDSLLAEIREHAGAGERVRVYRCGFRSYDIVKNGSGWLVLPSLGGPPFGTFDNICAAVLAGDRYVEAVRRGEFDVEDDGYPSPRGAA